MKKLILILMLTMATAVQAKVSDFNSMIEENSKEQSQLHKQIKHQLHEARQAMQEKEQREQKAVVMETGPSDYTVPTNKEMLTFEKEKKVKTNNSKKEIERLSSEIKAMDQEF